MSNAFGPSAERRVWLRAFWGFRPEEQGCLGFTLEGNRDRFIREYRAGDLVLIYGADQEHTPREQRRQVLGFLEVEALALTNAERSSEADQRRKLENGWQDRWSYAVPVRRAWRVTRTRIPVHHLARRTFETHNPVLIASRCELLMPEEAEAALNLPVSPVNVFGELPLLPEALASEAAIRDLLKPSRGVIPSFGDRIFSVEDDENRLYVLSLKGDTAAFLGRHHFEVNRKIIVKVVHAKVPQQRCDTHNAHLPSASQFKWKIELVSRPFPGGVKAKVAEDILKDRFAKCFETLGGEFFLGDETLISVEFAAATRAVSFVIPAP